MKNITDYTKFIFNVRNFDPAKDWSTDKGKIFVEYSTNGGMQTYIQSWTPEQFNEMATKINAFKLANSA
jgi:hypothetical protein